MSAASPGVSSPRTRCTSGARRETVEERLADHAVVRLPIGRRHTPLVDPPEVHAAPVWLEDRRPLVCVTWAGAPREPDVTAGSGGLGDLLRCCLARRRVVVEDDELDLAQRLPSASSFERTIAAWIAFRKAARTPARSSSRIAWIVVPPGLVTASRKLDRMDVLVAQELGGAEHRLDDELRRHLARSARAAVRLRSSPRRAARSTPARSPTRR